MTTFFRLSIIAVLCIFSKFAIAQNPTISIQSTLKNISGDAVADGTQSITFKLYNQLEGGSVVWEESADVEVVGGIYSHELGSVDSLVPSDFGEQLYLGVTISSKELSPRTKLGFAPYAMAVSALAGNGESASFDVSGTFVVSDDMSVVGESITNGITNTGTINSDIIISSEIISNGDILSNGNIGIDLGSISPKIALAVGDDNTGLSGSNNELSLHVNDTNDPVITIKSNGRVGIGTDSPETTLHVKGSSSNFSKATPDELCSGANFCFKGFERSSDHLQNYNGESSTFICANFEQSIVVQNKVYVGQVNSWSDKRIKTNLQKSNAKYDLALLNQIKITEYDHIDKVDKDNRRQKKVIAQQVADILPNAISKSRMVIPNVYEMAKEFEYKAGILSIKTGKVHDFAVGDKIDLKTPRNDLNNVKVIAVMDAHTFAVEADEKPDYIFVYGKYVDDFHSVDYDAIAMLNVSASQEMYRMIMDLQSANTKLVQENKELKSSTENIEDRLSALEAKMTKSENDKISNTDTAGK